MFVLTVSTGMRTEDTTLKLLVNDFQTLCPFAEMLTAALVKQMHLEVRSSEQDRQLTGIIWVHREPLACSCVLTVAAHKQHSLPALYVENRRRLSSLFAKVLQRQCNVGNLLVGTACNSHKLKLSAGTDYQSITITDACMDIKPFNLLQGNVLQTSKRHTQIQSDSEAVTRL